MGHCVLQARKSIRQWQTQMANEMRQLVLHERTMLLGRQALRSLVKVFSQLRHLLFLLCVCPNHCADCLRKVICSVCSTSYNCMSHSVSFAFVQYIIIHHRSHCFSLRAFTISLRANCFTSRTACGAGYNNDVRSRSNRPSRRSR